MSANAMLIRCLQQRPGGTTVKMADGGLIKFTPDENGDHVAMVSNPAYIQRLLSITEGYQIHAMPAPVAPVAAASPSDVVKADPEPTKAADAPVAPVVLPEPPPADTGDLYDLDDEQIKAVYRVELKREPHHKAKRETMIAQIEALREENKA